MARVTNEQIMQAITGLAQRVDALEAEESPAPVVEAKPRRTRVPAQTGAESLLAQCTPTFPKRVKAFWNDAALLDVYKNHGGKVARAVRDGKPTKGMESRPLVAAQNIAAVEARIAELTNA